MLIEAPMNHLAMFREVCAIKFIQLHVKYYFCDA